MSPQAVEILTTVVTTVIGAVLPPIVKWLIERGQKKTNEKESKQTRRKMGWKTIGLVSIGLALPAGLFGYYLGGPALAARPFALSSLQGESDLTTVAPPATGPVPTSIPRGEPLMEINCVEKGDGQCNDYNPGRLGYENQMYYVIPRPSKGYIAICHKNDELESEGSLQVTAFPDGSPSQDVPYGFGVLFGWKGGGLSTTDACIFEVRRVAGATEAAFTRAVNGQWSISTQRLDWLALDNSPHTLRAVLQPDGWGQVYLDERFLGSHRFEQCGTGPLGIVAWGPGDLKIRFDDLKLFALP